MNLIHRSPFGNSSLQNGTHDLFDSLLPRWPVEPADQPSTWKPAVDVCESENELLVHVDLPGIDLKLMNARVENNILTIRGERRLRKSTGRRLITASSVRTASSRDRLISRLPSTQQGFVRPMNLAY